MLSDEEKKAIEIIKFLQYKCIEENGTGMMSIYRIDDLANAIKILLNLIENQQKEIEELKERNNELNEALDEWINGERIAFNCVSKDKIKAKIEELEKQAEEVKNHYKGTYACLDEYLNAKSKIQGFKELLEKE